MFQRGIALVQILLISAVLSVFALYLTYTARDQVKIATWANNRVAAEQAINSAYAEILFYLFTNEKRKAMPDNDYQASETFGGHILSRWNFHGEFFQLSPLVKVKIQDLGGRLSMHFIDSERYLSFLTANGVSQERADVIVGRLLDWQDADSMPRPFGLESNPGFTSRDGYIPDLTDLELFLELSEKEKSLLNTNTTIYFNGDFNPLTASKELMSSELGEVAASQIFIERKERDLNSLEFRQITGKSATEYYIYPSNSLEIELVAEVGDARLNKTVVINLKRYVKGINSPLNVLFEKG